LELREKQKQMKLDKRAGNSEQKEKCDTSLHPATSVELLNRLNEFAAHSTFAQPKTGNPRPAPRPHLAA